VTDTDLRLRFGDCDVSAVVSRAPGARCLLVLAHGAGAGMRHPSMETLSHALVAEGIATLRYQFPYMEAGGGRTDPQPLAAETVREAARTATRIAPDLPLFAGGRSFGGRMTSHAAVAGGLPSVLGLIFFAFPLHPANRPGISRADHLPNVPTPMLFLQGTRDELSDLELLRPVVEGLGDRATLHVLEAADHGFHVLKRSGRTNADVLSEAVDTVKSWTARVTEADRQTIEA
jgi:predicted alpha/beta-hydrolase family hydrolase